MLHFHYCQNYLDNTEPELHDSLVKILKEFSKRSTLKGVGKISSFTKGISVLKLRRRYTAYIEIILEEKNLQIENNNLIVYFIRGFKNNLQDYVEIRDGKWLDYNPLEQEEIESFTKTYIQNNKKETEVLEEPPVNLIKWQNEYSLKVDYNIYESEDWIKFSSDNMNSEIGMKNDDIKSFSMVLNDIVLKRKYTENKKNIYYHVRDEFWGIVFTIFNFEGKEVFFLLDGANLSTQKEKWDKILDKEYEIVTKITNYNELSRNSIKAYPSWVVKDPEIWYKIQINNILGNLSLLPEQTEFLREFKFPKYINGQAGSGKSTMMYYLFANIFYYKSAGQINGDVIFLTEHPKLLDHTRNSVIQLLSNNPEFDISSEYENLVELNECFHPFKEFLLSFLPEDFNFESSFNQNKYLNFSKFKLLYEDSKLPIHTKNRYSAELVWFTITTYVYGNNIDEEITSENYHNKMPKDGKEIIPFDLFKNIEQNIIHPFYNKLIEEGYWDRIHLIKYILKNCNIEKSFDVIFCDEAQDFSKVELEFILKLSTYTKYNLSNVEQFPIVFAGDALQTVNPTGFRSESLTSMIYETLTDTKTGYKIDTNNLVFTPNYNYRSSQPIVEVANAIQNYRRTQFKADVKKPQESKKPTLYENEHLNVFIPIENFETNEELKNKVKTKNIIVPTNSDEIEIFKKDNPPLKDFKNIISSVDAKGLDFNQVVVYGFGKYYKENISDSKENLYESRFFYNKLYVGVTRAQTELIIIDSDESKLSFWKPLIDEYLKSPWINKKESKDFSFDNIIIFETNEIISEAPEIELFDANRQYEQGIFEKNKSLLLLASSHFIKLDEKNKHRRCLAAIAEIDEKWDKAGDLYLNEVKLRNGIEKIDYEKAIIAYWNGRIWKKLNDIIDNISNNENRIRKIITSFYLEGKINIYQLGVIFEEIKTFKKIITPLTWKNELIDDLYQYLLKITNEEEISILTDILFELTSINDKTILLKLSEIYFSQKRFQNTIDVFEKLEDENYELFYKAKLEIAKRKNDYEEIIIWNGRLAMENFEIRKDIAHEIINTFNLNNKESDKFNNIYVYLYTYFSSLFLDDVSNSTLNIAKKTEELFSERKRELMDFYFKILISNTLSLKCKNIVLERWAKFYDAKSSDSLKELNSEYKDLSKKINVIYHPFNLEELSRIPKIINSFEAKEENHFTNFKVFNFKKFEELEIKNIGEYNLIVGDNNIGKTSLLEALLFNKDKNQYLKRLIYAYVNRTNLFPDKNESSTDIVTYSYKLNNSFLNEFKKDKSKELVFSLKRGRVKSIYKVNFETENIENSETINLLFDNEINLEHIDYTDVINQAFIPYGKGFSSDLGKAYDKHIRTSRTVEKEFLDNIKVFIPNIESIYVNANGLIEIREINSDIDIPLYQYGEGANKLFRILILLSIHKGDILLIDEIDAGIHYSRFSEFWKVILTVAERQNTQIFATTHNEECINYFTQILNDDEFDGLKNKSRVIQLKQILDKISVRTFEFDSMNMAFERNIEIRG